MASFWIGGGATMMMVSVAAIVSARTVGPVLFSGGGITATVPLVDGSNATIRKNWHNIWQ